jgi:hypothetical protein
MKNKHIATYLVSFILISTFFLGSCKNKQFPAFSNDQILLFAKPEGGIGLYNFPTKQKYTLTTNKDYFPHLAPDKKTVYFIRVGSSETNQGIAKNPNNAKQILSNTINKKTNRWAEIVTFNLETEKEQKISTIPLYDPGTDPKDLVRFVDQNKKIIVFSHFYPIRMFEVSSGKMISENPSPYFAECNVESNNQSFFVHVRQLPKKDFIISFDQLEIPDYSDSLLEVSTNGNLIEIRKSEKEQINKKYFNGFTYYVKDSEFIYSYDHELYSRSTNGEERLLFAGMHPFCYSNKELTKEVLKFPWFQCSFLLQDTEKIILGEQNRLSLLDKKKKQLFMFSKEMLQLSNNDPDPLYLYDHLEWLSFTKNKSAILLISSKKIDEKAGPDRIVDLSKRPDLVLLLKWENEKFQKLYEMNEKKDFTLDFKDLDNDGLNEIINHYSASNFLCEERFQAAGRSLLWIDIYHTRKDGTYEVANQNYPAIYIDLLKKLKPYYQRALSATRLKEPILCEDDLKKLETLVREAEIITRTH